ncbi:MULTISPECIES: pilin [unclassified Nonomuraea]|uniref:pilin n=1 Tax=unclassified Nonomuraea TaxID=2593643 RepID=UPI0033D498D9
MSTDLRETPFRNRSPLDVAEHVFQLLACAPGGLALDGRDLPHGLPRRPVLLTELRDLLSAPTLPDSTKDGAWRELVIRARGEGRQWLVATAGMAEPALRQICGRLGLYLARGERDDVEAAVLAAFISAVKKTDLAPCNVLQRLCALARDAGERARQKAEAEAAHHPDLPGPASGSDQAQQRRHDSILADAVLAGDLDPALARAVTSAIRRRAENTPKTSARGRITSDPKPGIIKQKGGWGTPTGSARNPSSPRPRRYFLRAIVMAATVAVVLAAAAQAAAAEPTLHLYAAAVPKDLNTVFDNLRNWLIGLLAGLATLMLTIGGLRYLVAGGDPGEVQKAKAALKAAAFGYGLAILAPLFVSVLKRIVGGG